jgi:hypothetical protein
VREYLKLTGTGGQTGSFPYSEISNHYEPNEACQTSIRKRPLRPPFLSPISRFPAFLVELMLCSLVVGDLVKGSTGETQKAVELFRTSQRRLLWGAR